MYKIVVRYPEEDIYTCDNCEKPCEIEIEMKTSLFTLCKGCLKKMMEEVGAFVE